MSNKLPFDGVRVPFMEHHWMGDGLSDEQRRGVLVLIQALEHYARGPDGGLAEHALRVEAARRENHASIGDGSRVPPYTVNMAKAIAYHAREAGLPPHDTICREVSTCNVEHNEDGTHLASK